MIEPPSTSKRGNRFQRLWQIAIEPAATLKDPLARQRTRLLNSLMVIFLPLATMVLIVHMAILPIENLSQSSTIKAIIMGIGMVTLIYVFSRIGYYRFTKYLTLTLGFIAIITNALASDPPHFEIAYLIMLPLLGTLLLSFRETLILAVMTLICLIGFDIVLRHEIPLDTIKDLIVFMTFTEAFILFVSHHRNRLEADRHQLIIEQERNQVQSDK